MSELDEMRQVIDKGFCRILSLRVCFRDSKGEWQPMKGLVKEMSQELLEVVLSAKTDKCHIAVVRNEGELPDGVFDYKQHERIFLEAGYVQKVKE